MSKIDFVSQATKCSYIRTIQQKSNTLKWSFTLFSKPHRFESKVRSQCFVTKREEILCLCLARNLAKPNRAEEAAANSLMKNNPLLLLCFLWMVPTIFLAQFKSHEQYALSLHDATILNLSSCNCVAYCIPLESKKWRKMKEKRWNNNNIFIASWHPIRDAHITEKFKQFSKSKLEMKHFVTIPQCMLSLATVRL